MSKRIKQPKTTPKVRQGNLFTDGLVTSSLAKAGSLREEMGAELRSRLADQQALTTGIVDKIATHGNLITAFKRVYKNRGRGGVDGISVEEYRNELMGHVRRLSQQLLNGAYEPQAVRGVEIDKPNGGKRQLGIPTVEDRVVQQAIHQQLSAVYEPYFSPHSYGFRPGRSASQAIQSAAQYVESGKQWVVDMDLKSFFDEINHDRLINRLNKAITDKRLVDLIGRFLRAGLMHGGLLQQRIKGSPQGGPLSPLLSNIVLDELDRELTLRGLSFVRYADDFNIFVKSERSAHRVLSSIYQFLETRLRLKVNYDKSGVRLCDQTKFLGFTVLRTGKIRISDANIVKFKKKIIEVTKRNRGKSFASILAEVNQVISGWANYFKPCNTWLSDLKGLEGWLRCRLRVYRLKQCKRVYPTYRFLKGLGVRNACAWNAAQNMGWKAMSAYRPVSEGLGVKWFQDCGLKSLVAIQSS